MIDLDGDLWEGFEDFFAWVLWALFSVETDKSSP
jgi:hypothetical protein